MTVPSPRRRHFLLAAFIAFTAFSAMGSFASGALAETSTSSPGGNAAATNYGFDCDADYNWLHQNWPNISVRSADNQNVYTRSYLYKFKRVRRHHHRRYRWRMVDVSQWYVGVSNVTGRKVLGYTVGGLPYYFAIPGTPSLVPANDGYGFLGLGNGSYKTLEEYSAGGEDWYAWSRSMWDSVSPYCTV